MADDKNARDEQADNEERRQRERELEEALDRAEEPEPRTEDPLESFDDLDGALEAHDYPTTTEALIEAFGDREVDTREGRTSIEGVLVEADTERYDSADEVRSRIRELVHR